MAPYKMLADDIVANTINTTADRASAPTSRNVNTNAAEVEDNQHIDEPKKAINPNGVKPSFKLRVPAFTQTELNSMFGAFETDFGAQEISIPEFAYNSGENQDKMTPESCNDTVFGTDDQSNNTSDTTVNTPSHTPFEFNFDVGGSAKDINDRIAYQPVQAAIDAAIVENATNGVGFQFAVTGTAKSIQERVTSPEDEKATESSHDSDAVEKNKRGTTARKGPSTHSAIFGGKHLPFESVHTDDREDDEDEEMCDVSGSDHDSDASENDHQPSTSGKSLVRASVVLGYKRPPSNFVRAEDSESETDEEMANAAESEDDSSDENNEEPSTGRPNYGVKRPPSNFVRVVEDETESEENVHSDIDAGEESGQETEAETPTAASKSVPSARKTTSRKSPPSAPINDSSAENDCDDETKTTASHNRTASRKSIAGSEACTASNKSAPATAGKTIANNVGHNGQVSGNNKRAAPNTAGSTFKPVSVEIDMSLKAIATFNTVIPRKFRQLAEQKNVSLVSLLVNDIPKQKAQRGVHLRRVGRGLDDEQGVKEDTWEDVVAINNKIQKLWNSSPRHTDKSRPAVYEKIDALNTDRARMLAAINEEDAPRTLLGFIPYEKRFEAKTVSHASAPQKLNASPSPKAVTSSSAVEVEKHALDNTSSVQANKRAESATESVGEKQNSTSCNELDDKMDVDDDLDSLFGGGLDGHAGDDNGAMVEPETTERLLNTDSKETGGIVASDELNTSCTTADSQIQDVTAQEQPQASNNQQLIASSCVPTCQVSESDILMVDSAPSASVDPISSAEQSTTKSLTPAPCFGNETQIEQAYTLPISLQYLPDIDFFNSPQPPSQAELEEVDRAFLAAYQACQNTQDNGGATYSSAEHESLAPLTVPTEQEIEQTDCSEPPIMVEHEPVACLPIPSEQPIAQDDCNEPSIVWDDDLSALLDLPTEQSNEHNDLTKPPVISDDDFEALLALPIEQLDVQNNCSEPPVRTEEDYDFADVMALADILAEEEKNRIASLTPIEEQVSQFIDQMLAPSPAQEQPCQQQEQTPAPLTAPAMAAESQNQLWADVPAPQQSTLQVGLADTTVDLSAAYQQTQHLGGNGPQLSQHAQAQPPQQDFQMQDFSHTAQMAQIPRQQIPQAHQPQQPDALQPAADIQPVQNTAKQTQTRRRVSRKKKDDEASLAPMPPMDANDYQDYQQFSQDVHTQSQALPANTTARKYLGESWKLINEQHIKTTPPNPRQVGCLDSMVQGFQVKQRQISAEIKAAEEAERLKDTASIQETQAIPQLQYPQQMQAVPPAQQSTHQSIQTPPNVQCFQAPQTYHSAQATHDHQFVGNQQVFPGATQPQPQASQQAFAMGSFSPGTAIMNIQAEFLATAPGSMADLPASTVVTAPPQTPQHAQPTHGQKQAPAPTPSTSNQTKSKGKGPGRPCKANADLASQRRRHAKTLPVGPEYTQAPTPEQRAAKKAAKQMTRTQSSSSSVSAASSNSSAAGVQYDAHPGARLGLGTSASDYVAQQAETKKTKRASTSRARKATQAIQQMPEPSPLPLAPQSRVSIPSPYRHIAPRPQVSQSNGHNSQPSFNDQGMAADHQGHMPMAPMQQPQQPQQLAQSVAQPPAPMMNDFGAIFQQCPMQQPQPVQHLMAPTAQTTNNGTVDMTQAQFGGMPRQSMSQTPPINNGGQGLSVAQKRKRSGIEQQQDTGRQKRQNLGTSAGGQGYQDSPMPAQMQPQRPPMPNGGLDQGQNGTLRSLMQYNNSLHQQIAQNCQQMNQLGQIGHRGSDLYQCLVQQNMTLQSQVQQCMQQISVENQNAMASFQQGRIRVSDEAGQFGSHVNRAALNNMDFPSAFQGGYNHGPYMPNNGMN